MARRLLRRAALVVALVGCGVAAPTPARAAAAVDTAPASVLARREYSPYESERIRQALDSMGARRDLEPEGKEIEAVHVWALDPFDDADAFPTWPNVFHATSRDYVVRREVLMHEGELYQQRFIDETERNLRALPQIGMALVIPIEGSAPSRVRLVVITKDIWSLRLSWSPRVVDGYLDRLALSATERNLLGTGRQLAANLSLTPSRYQAGLEYVEPRIAGSRVRFAAEGGVFARCPSNALEGYYGTLWYGKPQYSTRTRWAWNAQMQFTHQVFRIGDAGASVCSGEGARSLDVTGPVGEITDRTRLARGILIPARYRTRAINGASVVLRSFGVSRKVDVSSGLEFLRAEAEPVGLESLAPEYTLSARRRFGLPTPQQRVGPFLSVALYENRFQRTLDVDRLGIQEDFRLGYVASLKLYSGLDGAGSSRDVLGSNAALSYTWPLGSGLVRPSVGSVYELSAPETAQAEATAGLRFVSPSVGIGRFVTDTQLIHRYRNFLGGRTLIGGTYRLRGYAPDAFLGQDVLISNTEFRTRPVELFSVMLGAALFYDVGDAFNGFDDLQLKQAAGAGLRVLLPQIDKDVFRMDFGFPLTRDPYGEFKFIAQFFQAF